MIINKCSDERLKGNYNRQTSNQPTDGHAGSLRSYTFNKVKYQRPKDCYLPFENGYATVVFKFQQSKFCYIRKDYRRPLQLGYLSTFYIIFKMTYYELLFLSGNCSHNGHAKTCKYILTGIDL